MIEEDISTEPENNVAPVTDQTNAQTVESETGNNGLAKAAIGGVVGAVLGTVAIALANKKTAQEINRTVKGVGNTVKGAASSVNFSVKNAVEAVKGVAKGVNETVESVKNNQTTTDVNETVKNAASIKETVTSRPNVHKSDINQTVEPLKPNLTSDRPNLNTTDINQTVENSAATVKPTVANDLPTVNNKIDTQATVADSQPFAKQSIKLSDNYTFELYEERLVANKRQIKTGEVSIAKHVETHKASISVPLDKERLIIEQIPVNAETPVAASEPDFAKRELVRVEIYEETADVQKQPFLREQISVRKQVEHDTFEVEENIRREELDFDVQDHNINDLNNTI